MSRGGQGQGAAGSPGISVAPVLEKRWCIDSAAASPAPGSATLRPARGRGSSWLPGLGAFSPARRSPVPSAPLPCCGCPGAGRTWPAWGTGAELKWERLGPAAAAVESCLSLSLWLEVLGSCVPTAPRPSCLGTAMGAQDSSSPRLVVGTKPALPQGLSHPPQCQRGPACWGRGRGSPRGSLQPPRQPGVRPLRIAATFYSWGFTGRGGGGGLLLNRVCIFGAF